MNRPRIGFLGTGWIGRHRMAAICASGHAEAAAIADPDAACLAEARAIAPGAAVVPSLAAMLEMNLDGIVIATPSALHAEQTIAALASGASVFCQKPLGRNAGEVREAIAAARKADRLLAVDFSYRNTAAGQAVKRLVEGGGLGRIYAADLQFHNAYGPDKEWFYDRDRSGGGCVMDLGIHLVDWLLWTLGFPAVRGVASRLHAGGCLLPDRPEEVEDYATAELDLAGDVSARIACSWRLHAGQDAVISATFYGTEGGASIRNLRGSFYDFEAVLWRGTASKVLVSPPDEWGGRAAAAWAELLAVSPAFADDAERLANVAGVIDRIYGYC